MFRVQNLVFRIEAKIKHVFPNRILQIMGYLGRHVWWIVLNVLEMGQKTLMNQAWWDLLMSETGHFDFCRLLLLTKFKKEFLKGKIVSILMFKLSMGF